MTTVTIQYTTRYIKDFKKLSPSLQRAAAKREEIFKKDPHSPELKTHKLSGKLQDFWAFSITHHDRILFRFISQTQVIFYKIGSHDIYK